MRIFNFRLEPPGSGRNVLARFDVSVVPGIALCDLALRENSAGKARILIPETRGRTLAAIIDKPLQDDIAAAATEKLNLAGGPEAREVKTATA